MESASGKSIEVGEGGSMIDLGGSSYNMFVLSSPRQSQSDLKVGVEEYGGADGATIVGGHRAPIRETINCLILADQSVSDIEKDLIQKMRDVLGILNRSTLQWYAFDIDNRFTTNENFRGEAIINGPINTIRKSLDVYEFQLNFLYPAGKRFSAEINSVIIGIDSVSHVFPPHPSTSVMGNVDTDYCLLEIKNTHSQTFTSVRIRVDVTSTDLTTLGSLVAGETMVIDSRTQHIYKKSDGSSLMAGVIGSGTFPKLKPGVANSLTLDITTTSPSTNMYDIDLKWRGAFIL